MFHIYLCLYLTQFYIYYLMFLLLRKKVNIKKTVSWASRDSHHHNARDQCALLQTILYKGHSTLIIYKW
jgi:hypothetical protein